MSPNPSGQVEVPLLPIAHHSSITTARASSGSSSMGLGDNKGGMRQQLDERPQQLQAHTNIRTGLQSIVADLDSVLNTIRKK